LSLRRKRSSPNVFEMAAKETITSIILINLISVSLGTVRHPRRFKIVVIDIQITLIQMLNDFIVISYNLIMKIDMFNIISSFIKMHNILFLSFYLPMHIETMQLFLHVIGYSTRSVDIDDVILNGCGIIIGYYVMFFYKKRQAYPRPS